jgi:hypothetical protein
MSFSAFAKLIGVSPARVTQLKPRLQDAIVGKKIHAEKAQEILDATLDKSKDHRPRFKKADKPVRKKKTYNDWKELEAEFSAKREKIAFEKESGALVDAAEVEMAAFNRARIFRDAMLNIPHKISQKVAAERDEFKVMSIMTDAIRKALEAEAAGGDDEVK